MHLQYEAKDAASIVLKFEIRDMSYEYEETNKISNTLGVVETTLDVLIAAKSRGLILSIPFFNAKYGSDVDLSQINPGQCFLRAEILAPVSAEKAVLLQFAVSKASSCWRSSRHYLEIHKLNEETLFELPQPYTLIHRSELVEAAKECDYSYWHPIVTPLSRLCNGNMERVLKLAIFDPDKTAGTPIGFVLTTLRKLLTIKDRILNIIQSKDGKVGSCCVSYLM
jgi:hypothetical protein